MVPIPELVVRAQAGDIDAFSEVVRRVQDTAVAYAYARLGDRQLAEDAAQESLVDAFRLIGQLREPAKFQGWLRTILAKQADRIRRKKRPVAVELEVDLAAALEHDPLESHARAQRRERVLAAVLSLPEAERVAIVLFYAGGHTIEEIAAFTDEPGGTVKRRLHEARHSLKERMLDMVKDTLEDLRPSKTPEFVERVARLLAVIASGERAEAAELVDGSPTLVNVSGPHPLWGGEPLPLQVAAELGRVEQIELLLDHGADPDAQAPGYGAGWTPLALALHAEHREAAELLVRRGATVDLCAAAALGDSARVASLLERDPASVHRRGPNDATALHLAATLEVAKTLIDAGANLDATDAGGITPERFAVWFPARRDVALFVLEVSGRKADVFFAAAAGELESLREMVTAEPALLHKRTSAHDGTMHLSSGGDSPLHVAALHGHPEVVRLLLELGADANARNSDGQTALHLAVGGRGVSSSAAPAQREVVELLLDHGADVGAVETQHGGTPLGWARFHGRHELAELMVLRGG